MLRIKILIIALVIFSALPGNAQSKNIFISAKKCFRLKSADWFMIDVRSNNEFQKSHIPGSLNIPLRIFHEKKFLNGEKIILVGSGLNDREIENVVINLKKNKMGTLILKGGINSWHRSHRGVTGLPFDKESLKNISISDFYKSDKKRAITITTGLNMEKSLRSGLVIYLSENDFMQPGSLTEIVKKEKKRFDIVFLLMDDFIEKISQELTILGFDNIFHVQGSPYAYLDWAEKMDLTSGSSGKVEKLGTECVPCLKNIK